MKLLHTRLLRSLLLFTFLWLGQQAFAYDATVALDGTGTHATLQAAINAAPNNGTVPFRIFIKNGRYREKITVASNKTNVQLIGESVSGVLVYYDDPATTLGTQNSASFSVNANDFMAYNITFANTFDYNAGVSQGQTGLQAVAVLVNADRAVFKNCRFLGNQDTLYLKGNGTPRHYFNNCYIDGIIDFVFGSAIAVFDSTVVYAKVRSASGSSYINAPNTPAGQAYGFVYRNCLFPANDGATTYYFARPWQNSTGSNPYAENKTAILNSRITASIRPEGWVIWDAGTNTSLITFAEYNSRHFNGNTADISQRVSWSKQLNATEAAAYTNANLFGTWDPCAVAAEACATTALPLAVANFTATKGTSSTLRWNTSWPRQGLQYRVFRSTTSRSTGYSLFSTTTATSDSAVNFSGTDVNPPSGSAYYYYVQAVRPGADTAYSDTAVVSSQPTIVTTGTIGAFYQTIGTPSGTQSYTVSGTDLQGSVTITPPANYEVGNGGTWYSSGNPLVLTQTGGTLAATTLQLRLNANAAGTYNGNVVHTSLNAQTVNVAVTGTAAVAPTINSIIVQQWPLETSAADDAATRSANVTASQPTFRNLYVSNGTTVAAVPAYSTTYGQAFSATANGDGSWGTASGGPGGNLNRSFYEQFTITATGQAVRIDSLIFSSAFYGTNSNTKVGIVYSRTGFTTADSTTNELTGTASSGGSVTGTFAAPITLNNVNTGIVNHRLSLGGNGGDTLMPNQTLTIRFYFSCGSSSTGRYGLMKGVVMKGEAIAGTTLPIERLTLTAGRNSRQQPQLQWQMLASEPVASVELHRSTDGQRFDLVKKVEANTTQAIDEQAPKGNLYYRLKAITAAGQGFWSNVARLADGQQEIRLQVWPNPATQQIQLSFASVSAKAQLQVINMHGAVVRTQAVAAGNNFSSLNVEGLAKGNYLVSLKEGQSTQTVTLIIQ